MLTMVDNIVYLDNGMYLTWKGDTFVVYDKLGHIVDKGNPPWRRIDTRHGERLLYQTGSLGYVMVYMNKENILSSNDTLSATLEVDYCLYEREE